MGQTGNGVQLETTVDLPTRFGKFRLSAFSTDDHAQEHLAIIHGEIDGAEDCPGPRPLRVPDRRGVRLAALRLPRAARRRAVPHRLEQPRGAVIYLRQEGRGIGLINKLHAYRLQDDEGMDTIEANQHLGLPVDARDYRIAARILELLKVRSVSLLTNNMGKIEGLRAEGIAVTDRIPLVTSGNPFNQDYLETKRTKMGHLL